MSAIRLAVAAVLVLGLTGTARAEEKGSAKEKIVGVWEATKGDGKGTVPPGSTVEFTKDGKLKIVIKMGDKSIKIEGTYKFEGDKKVKSTLKVGDKEMSEILELTKLTDKELVIKDEKGMIDTFKKSK